MLPLSAVTTLSDAALLDHVGALVARDQRTTAELVASLSELDARRLYLGAGYSSLFTYCTDVLHLSEYAAYGRIKAARRARRFPEILERLADGSVTLTTVSLLAPLLTSRNVSGLLKRARHKSKREVEHLVAEMRPKPDVPTVVRKTPSPKSVSPTPSNASQSAEPISMSLTAPPVARPADIRPLAAETYKVQFTLSRSGYEHLRRAQDLLRHSIPNGDAAQIFERGLTMLVEELEKKKLGATGRPNVSRPAKKHSRYISTAVKHEVWRRDGGRCAFVGTRGRCTERAFLEFHHVIPFADGGATSAANLQLRCRSHNQHESNLWGNLDPSQLGPDPAGSGLGTKHSASTRGREPP
jgi:hypothetical protein